MYWFTFDVLSLDVHRVELVLHSFVAVGHQLIQIVSATGGDVDIDLEEPGGGRGVVVVVVVINNIVVVVVGVAFGGGFTVVVVVDVVAAVAVDVGGVKGVSHFDEHNSSTVGKIAH